MNSTIKSSPAFLIIIVSFLFIAQAKPLVQSSIKIKGKVIAYTTPVSNAEIIFTDNDNPAVQYKVVSDYTGYYEIDVITSIEEQPIEPTSFELIQNYPNPFTSTTAIPYIINKQSGVSLKIFDILGREVKQLNIGEKLNGNYTVSWDGTNDLGEKVSAGIYFYQLQAGNERQVKKMVLGGGNYNTIPSFNSSYFSESKLNRKQNIKKAVINNFTVKVNSYTNTSPQIISKTLTSIVLQNDTIINLLVSEVDKEFVLCYLKSINQRGKIILSNIDGTKTKIIASNSSGGEDNAKWSPDGRYIVYNSGSYLMFYDTSRDTIIKLINSSEFVFIGAPMWTPDSKKILCTGYKIGEPQYRYLLSVDGTIQQKLPDQFNTIMFFYNNSYDLIYFSGNSIFKSNIDATYNEKLLDFNKLGEIVGIYDFDPINNKLLFSLSNSQDIQQYIVIYNFNTSIFDTLYSAGTKQACVNLKFSNDYSKITFIEADYNTSYSNLSLIEDGKKSDLIKLVKKGEWLDFNRLAFSKDDKFIAYSKNIDAVVGNYVAWTSYLQVIELETKRVMEFDIGIQPQWQLK